MKNFIIDFLIGKKIFFEDPVLGQLYTRTRKNNPSIEKSWEAVDKKPPQLEFAFVAIEGNCNGPYPHQLVQVHHLLEHWNQTINAIDAKVKQQSGDLSKFSKWQEELQLTAMYPENDSFLLAFEKAYSSDEVTIYAYIKNGAVTEVTCE